MRPTLPQLPRAIRVAAQFAAVLLLLACASLARADAAPTCGPGRLAFEGGPDLTFTTPAAAFNCPCGANPESAAYDVPAGWLSVGDSCGAVGATAHVSVSEDFTLTGVAPGTPVSFVARVHLVGLMEFWWYDTDLQAVLKVGLLADAAGDSSLVVWAAGQPFRAVDVALSVPLTRPAGVPFTIVYELISGAFLRGSSTRGVARFDFAGLPPGVAIHSCRGYSQEASTPALPTSWGALKSRYH